MILLPFAILFAAVPLTIEVTPRPSVVVAADLDADGHTDLIVGCERAAVVLRNEGSGKFRESARIAMSRNPSEFAVADFDLDGKLDVAAADHDTFAIDILQGDGKGGLTKKSTFRARTSGKPHIHGLLAADWNSDDRPDLILISVDEGELVVMDGDGKGTFAVGRSVRLQSPFNTLRADLNGDGRIDLAIPQFRAGTLTVLLSDGKGAFVPGAGSPIKLPPRPYNVAAGDANADGKIDLAVSQDDIPDVHVLIGDGSGGFQPMTGSPFRFDQVVYQIAWADVNGDGREDLIGGGRDGLAVLLQGRDGGFRPGPKLLAERDSWRIAKADLDGDNRPDFIVPHDKLDRLTVLLSGR